MVATADGRWLHADGKSYKDKYEMLAFKPGQEYVLFLMGVPRRDDYPPQYGDILWVGTGEPDVALMDRNGRLAFETTQRYLRTIGPGGLGPVPGSDAPFELTRTDIERMVREGG